MFVLWCGVPFVVVIGLVCCLCWLLLVVCMRWRVFLVDACLFVLFAVVDGIAVVRRCCPLFVVMSVFVARGCVSFARVSWCLMFVACGL